MRERNRSHRGWKCFKYQVGSSNASDQELN